MTSFGYRLNPGYAIKECSSCGDLYTRDFCCSKGNVKDKMLVPKPPKNCARCARCGHPIDGPYCQGCSLLRKELEENLVTYFQYFQYTFKSSDDSTNIVNAPREPFVVKQDHDVNSSQNPPHIDERCYECGDALHGIFCQRCTCKSCGKGAHIGYNFPSKVSIIYNPEPKFNRYSFFEMPKVLLLAWDRVFEIKDAFGNKQYKPEEIQELFRKLLNDLQNIHDELAEYINSLGWNLPAFYDNYDDDDVDYTILITPVLSTEEPDNSLSMRDEHLDTIPATESEEVIKSSVEDLIPIPCKSEGILDTILEVAKIVIPEDEEIEDDNLREKLLNVNLLIAKIEALKDNPTPSSGPKISSCSTTTYSDISLLDYVAFYFYNDHIEEISSGSTTTHSDISLSEYDSFIFNLSNDQFPPTDRSDFNHEEFADELAHIISPPV
nr:hypothetical protein [Tanacetum cinerariifolium]